MAVDTDDHLVHVHFQFFGSRDNNSQVSLVRNQPIKFGLIHVIGFQRLVDDSSQGPHSNFEDLIAFHQEFGLSIIFLYTRKSTRNTNFGVEQVCMIAVGVNMGG